MSEKFKLLAVAGNPILHSKSPLMFNSEFKASHTNGVYRKILAKTAGNVITIMRELNFTGINVTAPFKKDIMPYLDIIKDDAKNIGAVNTIVNKDNLLIGTNTDYYGVIDSFKTQKISLSNAKILLVGAGGAAQGALYGLTNENADITIINRTKSKAKKLAKQFRCKFDDIENLEILLNQCDIFISTIPSFDFNTVIDTIKARVKPLVIFDANYKNSSLKVIKNAKIIDGTKWLYLQALPAYKFFLDKSPQYEAMKNALNRNFKTYKNIALIGFMATGKTGIGKSLNNLLPKMEFVDTDLLIENDLGMSISDIFEQKEEKGFREIETKIIKEVCKKENQIISFGGGAILSEENRQIISDNCLVIWLYSTMEETISRLNKREKNKRPLLQGNDFINKTKAIFKFRIPYYAQTCDVIVLNENENTEMDIAELIFG